MIATLYFDSTLHEFHGSFQNRHTEAGSRFALGTRSGGLVIHRKQVRQDVFRNAQSEIAHHQTDVLTGIVNFNLNFAARMAELDGIGNQVAQDLVLQKERVGQNRRRSHPQNNLQGFFFQFFFEGVHG